MEGLTLGFSKDNNSWIGLLLCCNERKAYEFLQELIGPCMGWGFGAIVDTILTHVVLTFWNWGVITGKNNSWRAPLNAARAPVTKSDLRLVPHVLQVDGAKPGLWWVYKSECLSGKKEDLVVGKATLYSTKQQKLKLS